jgi:hypothetical protein
MSAAGGAQTGPQGQSLVVESQAAMIAKARRAAKAEMLAAKREPAWKIAARAAEAEAEAEAKATVNAEERRAPLDDEELESLFAQVTKQGLPLTLTLTSTLNLTPTPTSTPNPNP